MGRGVFCRAAVIYCRAFLRFIAFIKNLFNMVLCKLYLATNSLYIYIYTCTYTHIHIEILLNSFYF
jgi:hypothetical protein